MALSLRQQTEYLGKDRWKWSVWLDGPPEELDRVDHVEYVLHSSFPKPVRNVSDRSSQFRLDSSGWGAFTIYATAFGRNREEIPLEHELELLYPDGTPTLA